MTTYQLRGVDPADEEALRAWWEVGAAATAERPADPWPPWEADRIRRATTFNLAVNQHMAAVNQRLGYRVVEDLIELQKVLEA